MARTLAQGRPVSQKTADEIADGLGVARDAAQRFLGRITERDGQDNIVGIFGLSLNKHPHRMYINGRRLFAWCAADTLFLPGLLGQTAVVESRSPLSKETIRLTVSPRGVEDFSPPGAVLSLVVVDPDKVDVSSVPAIWSTFCHHIFFFASREEAERWAAGRDDIEILTVAEGDAVVRRAQSRLLAYAAEADQSDDS